jgi:hypothetical protein
LVLVEDADSETISFDDIIDIVYHDEKAKNGRLDINLKNQKE